MLSPLKGHILGILLMALTIPIRPCNAEEPAVVLKQWNDAFLDAIRVDSSPPGVASRKMAILHLAMFEAANSIQPKYHSYLSSGAPKPQSGLNAEQVAISAALQVGRIEFPAFSGKFRMLRDRFLKADGDYDAASEEHGIAVADHIINLRGNDGSSRSITYIPKNEVGIWKRTPPKFRPPETPQWMHVKPFCTSDTTEYSYPSPPSITSEAYAEAWKQVKELGGKDSTIRTEDQTEIAHFWSCFTYTATPAGHWNEIACNLLVDRKESWIDSLHLLALMNLALADAGVAAWKVKYEKHFWRPIYAIRQADQDGNSATVSEPSWDSLLEAPPHPEFVSGHSTYTGAGAEVIRRWLGTDRVSFSTTSDSLPGVFRSFESISECEHEIGMSRIYGGIHFLFSNLDGLELGHQVGRNVFENYLQTLE